MSRATLAIFAMVCCTFAAAEGTNPPPHPLHKVGDHWTPYDPPTEFGADVQVYIIQPGDTLWDLAKKNLGNPYLWPQLWEKNKYIRDAHWIYPGDPLALGPKVAEAPADGGAAAAPAEAGAGTVPTVTTAAPETTGEPVEAGGGAEGAGGKLVAVGSEDDLYCFAYLDESSQSAQLKMTSAEDIGMKEHFVAGDIVYIAGGEQEGVKAGQEFYLVLPDHAVRHPATGAILGTAIRYLGHLRVLCTQDHSATAEILSSCDAIPLGSWLKDYEPMAIPMTVLTPPLDICSSPNAKPKGYIVYAKDNDVSFGADHMVMLDLGEADQVFPGTVCTIYRDNPVTGQPRILLGEAAILLTGDHWATAKVIRSAQALNVGDRVEVK